MINSNQEARKSKMEAVADYLINEQLEKNPVGKLKDIWGGVGVSCIDWN